MTKRPPKHLLVTMAKASLVNGRELIKDAEVLLAAGRIPRAMALLILAVEEMSKGLLLWTWLSAERRGVEHSSKILWDGLRNHKAKLIMPGIVRELLQRPVDKSLTDEIARLTEHLPEIMRSADTSNLIKQCALYVQVEGTKVVSPSESITEDHARTALRLTNSWSAFLEVIERYLTEGGLFQQSGVPSVDN
jgi:AbiV family abortive infection protein